MKKFSNFMLYIGIFLFSYENFNFGSYTGILQGKQISLFIFIMYLIFNLIDLFRIKYNKCEKVFFVLFIFIILSGYCQAIITGKYKYIIFYLNGMIGVICTYLAIKIYFFKASKTQVVIFAKSMFWGITIIGGSFAILQIIYIYISSNNTIYNILNFLLPSFRYINSGRIQFATFEPASVGYFISTLLIPSAIYLYRIKKDKVYYIVTIFMVLLSMFTISSTTYLYIGISLIITFLFYVQGNKVKKLCISIFLIVSMFISGYFVIYQNIFNITNNHFERLRSICMLEMNTDNDSSIGARSTFIKTAAYGFKDKPILGWGPGRYIEAYKNELHKIAGNITSSSYDEVLGVLDYDTAYSHSTYFTIICENGLLGLLLVLNIITMSLSGYYSKNIFKHFSIVIMIMFVQLELTGALACIMWLAIFQNKSYEV